MVANATVTPNSATMILRRKVPPLVCAAWALPQGLAAWVKWDYPVPILLMKNGLWKLATLADTSGERKDGIRWPKG